MRFRAMRKDVQPHSGQDNPHSRLGCWASHLRTEMSDISTAKPRALALEVSSLALQNRVEKLHFALPAELGGLAPQMSHCHDNARRFCERNPGYEVVEGWIVQSVSASGTYLIRHSVVSDPAGNLTCVTLAASGQHEMAGPFVRHDPKWGKFDSFGPFINFVTGLGVLAS